MKILYWNVRGIANEDTQRTLRKLVRSHLPVIVCLAEPFVLLDSISVSFWRSMGLVPVATNNRGDQSPNLWFLCHRALSSVIVHNTDQQVSVRVTLDGVQCILTSVYAKTTIAGRRTLWQDLSFIQANFVTGPWLVFGDFNCLFGSHEKRGGLPPSAVSCQEFQQMCSSCQLLDVNTRGLSYTWTNRRTYERLDRALCNLEWIESWLNFDCRTLTKAASDHCPLLMSCSRTNVIKKPPFRFQRMWLEHPGFLDFIKVAWDNLTFAGCPMFIIASKLRALKFLLKTWNASTFGNVHRQVTEAEASLDAVQSELSVQGPSAERLYREDQAQAHYQNCLKMQDLLLRDKARVRWLKDGDRNTSFLHNMVKLRNLHNSISSLRVGNCIISDHAQISNHVIGHFERAFTRDVDIVDTGLVSRVIPHLVTDQDNVTLTSCPTSEEIHDAVFAMDDFSAPGPDGYGGCFFRKCWSIVGSDVISAVQSFFLLGFIPPNFNSSLIVLIPKKQEADSVTDFRPIALANFVFKIITKIMATRLGPVAARIISPNQSAFITGRSIVDPIILTSECINILDNECRGGNIALKLDISKAFDTLHWDFLLRVLKAFGFDSVFVNWVEAILK